MASRKAVPRRRPAPYIPRRHRLPEVTDEEFDDFVQDKRSFNGTQLAGRRVRQNLSVICAKYERSFEGECDEIDITTLTVKKDRGHLKTLPDKDASTFGMSLAIPNPIDPAFCEPPEDYDGKEEPNDEDIYDLEEEENEDDADDSDEDDDGDVFEEESGVEGHGGDSEMTELESESEEQHRGYVGAPQNRVSVGIGRKIAPTGTDNGYSCVDDRSSISGYSTPKRRESLGSVDLDRIRQRFASNPSSPRKDSLDPLAVYFGQRVNVRTPTKNSTPTKTRTSWLFASEPH
ncbi:hypothetical protein RvY_10461 [Ramazzottius varieornatus]|uniref:Uncharacterized protein n=1 Tax=Ramazzottius varieornatus TaxID=947166 RepID=A0A1D1VCT7_RAMVA|nr:hypothetical protein RvY_10461 [Ramazzottius varieornatus]